MTESRMVESGNDDVTLEPYQGSTTNLMRADPHRLQTWGCEPDSKLILLQNRMDSDREFTRFGEAASVTLSV